MNNTTLRRAAGVAAIVSVAAVGAASLGAGNAAAGRLPGGFISQTLVDGTKVTVSLKDEYVRYARSTAAVPTSRNVWLSGKVLVTASGSKPSVSVAPGYLVGCQLTFGASGNGAAGLLNSPTANDPDTPEDESQGGTARNTTRSASAGAGFTLGPGEATYVPMINYTEENDYGIESTVTSFGFDGNRGGFAYSEETFRLDNCAGYASAKARIKVKVSTDSVDGYVTLFGKPFSIG